MSTISDLTLTVTDIVAAQKIYASTALARIAEIEAWADEVRTELVDLASTQTITAKKTFSGGIDNGSEVLANVLDPVADQDAATKKYVNDQVATINDPAFGALTPNDTDSAPMVEGQEYQAEVDGFVMMYGGQHIRYSVELSVGTVSGSLTKVADIYVYDTASASICFPIAKDEYFKFTGPGDVAVINWRPVFEAGGCVKQ